MGLRVFVFVFAIISYVNGQTTFKVCVPSTSPSICQALDRDGSQASCESVKSRIDCALKLARGEADFGVFSEEEMLLLSKQQPNDHRVVASVRDATKVDDSYAFEAVAVVRSTHTNGLEGLRNGRYCHPGFDQADLRWSPRVLKTLEYTAARTDRCNGIDTDWKTAEEMEVEALSFFFSEGCRPGPWSANKTVDDNLKSRFPQLCSLCANSTCSEYPSVAVSFSGINSNNRHIQALTCLRNNGTVAYVAWQHVRDFFNTIYTNEVSSYSLLCEDGSLVPLNVTNLASSAAPCSFVKQPWGAIVANSARASEVQSSLRLWWPTGANPGGNTWQAGAFSVVGGTSARVVFLSTITSPLNYTSDARTLLDIDSTTSCISSRAWCTVSAAEQVKCQWLRQAAYVLGIQPLISCHQKASTTNPLFECLDDISNKQLDFLATPANYGYLARKHYKLSPVKTVQNSRSNVNGFSRIAAFVRETAASQGNITRFENLRGTKACFPEYGGIAYVSFVKAAQDRGVVSPTECNYARALGEFFSGACAPGAIHSTHNITGASDSYNKSSLCSVCRPATATATTETSTCAYDDSNLYFSNNGSLRCLADNAADVAIVEIQNINEALSTVNGLQATDLRALCRNNSLAVTTGVDIDDNCLLAYVVNSEVLTRRNDPKTNSLNELLENLDEKFGYNIAEATQLINLEMYSPFDGTSDLLFKDTAIGLSEPTVQAENEPSKNYIELFQHLESCSGATPSLGNRNNIISLFTLAVMTVLSRYVIY